MTKPENITRCPFCQTAFRVTGSQLGAADGAVRCGSCLQVFQARDYFFGANVGAQADDTAADTDVTLDPAETDDQSLLQQLTSQPEPDVNDQWRSRIVTIESEYGVPAPAPDPDDDFDDDFDGDYPELLFAEEVDAESMVPAIAAVVEVTDEVTDEEPVERTAAETIGEIVGKIAGEKAQEIAEEKAEDKAEDVEPAALQPAAARPLFEADSASDSESGIDGADLALEPVDPEDIVGPLQAPAGRRQWRWLLAAILMLVGLGAQYGWYQMNYFAQNASLRPYYDQLCRFVGCELPIYRHRELLDATDLVVRSQGAGTDVLLVDALIKNNGAFRQLFPDLVLSFTDADDRLVARRTFKPGEYLAGELTGLRYFPAYTEVRLSLEIVDPGKNALGYSLTIDPAS